MQPDGHQGGGHASRTAGMGQAAMRGGSGQSMRPGRHHHGFASVAQAASAADSAQVCPSTNCATCSAVEHTHVAEAAAQLEGRVQGAVQRIMDVGEAQVPDTAKQQMSLPMRHGGMDLIKLTPEVSQASYLSCAAQTHEVLREAAQPLQIFEGARSERLQQQWSALVSAVDGVPGSKGSKMLQRACGLKSSGRAQRRS